MLPEKLYICICTNLNKKKTYSSLVGSEIKRNALYNCEGAISTNSAIRCQAMALNDVLQWCDKVSSNGAKRCLAMVRYGVKQWRETMTCSIAIRCRTRGQYGSKKPRDTRFAIRSTERMCCMAIY